MCIVVCRVLMWYLERWDNNGSLIASVFVIFISVIFQLNSRLNCSSGHITWDLSTFVIVYYKLTLTHCIVLYCIIWIIFVIFISLLFQSKFSSVMFSVYTFDRPIFNTRLDSLLCCVLLTIDSSINDFITIRCYFTRIVASRWQRHKFTRMLASGQRHKPERYAPLCKLFEEVVICTQFTTYTIAHTLLCYLNGRVERILFFASFKLPLFYEYEMIA